LKKVNAHEACGLIQIQERAAQLLQGRKAYLKRVPRCICLHGVYGVTANGLQTWCLRLVMRWQ
jgi:hypothetical protein